MKKNLMIVMAVAAALAATSCKTQKLYREASTVADPAQQVEEVQTVTRTTTTTTTPRTTPTVEKGDRQEKVTVVGDGQLKDYNVVVGSFGSKANADAMRTKMIGRGYQAFLVQNQAGMYRVVAGAYDTRSAATTVRDNLRSTYASEAGTCAEAWLLIPAL